MITRKTDTAFSRHILYFFLPVILLSNAAYVSANQYRLEISKSAQELVVTNGTEVIKKYRVVFGKGGTGTKRVLGDNKTPNGTYHIMDFKADSKFHYFMQIDYPNLLDAWHGYKNELISAKDFKNIAIAYKKRQMPPQHTALGGYIGIHGIGETTREKLKIHEVFNWTEGCIAMKNDEINDLKRYVSIGTKVIIKE